MNDYATLARIEDHLRRQADASERIADALERAHTAYMDIEAGDLRPGGRRWDDCETRDPNRCEPGCTRPSLHDGDCDAVAPINRWDAESHCVMHGDDSCVYGPIHSDAVSCVYRCTEPMDGHHCTRAEHSAWEPHAWAVDETPACCGDDATDTDGATT